MKINLLCVIILLITTFRCQSVSHVETVQPAIRNCECPMEELPDEKTIEDSSSTVSKNSDLFDWSLKGKIRGEFRSIINGELDSNIQANKNQTTYSISTNKIVEKLNNNYPQLVDDVYSFKLGKVFYCTYHSVLCQDTTVSDSLLTVRSLEKLEEFKKEILEKIHKKKIDASKHTTPTVKKRVTSNKKSTPLDTLSSRQIDEDKSININSGTNNGIIGNNNTINFSKPPLELNDFDKYEILTRINNILEDFPENKTRCIEIASMVNTSRSRQFGNMIHQFLKEKGFNVGTRISVFQSYPRGDVTNAISIHKGARTGCVEIEVYDV